MPASQKNSAKHVSPVSGNEPSWALGAYARTSHGIVTIVKDCKNGYNAVPIEGNGDERFYRADELSQWLPLEGERVIEADNEDSITGIVLHAGERTSLVKWSGFVRPQTWANANLEPAWETWD